MGTLDSALSFVRSREAAMLALARQWVDINSYTSNVAGVDAVGALLQQAFALPSLACTQIAASGYGTHLVWRTAAASSGAKPIVLIGHHDTVFPPGHFEGWRDAPDGRAIGPGALDMKGGLAVIHTALSALDDAGVLASLPLIAISVSDEEVGSPTSAAHLRELAKSAACALVFESGRAKDMIITRRKGVGAMTIVAHGKAAHAGNNHKDGANAIWALAKFVDAAQALTSYERGVTVNVGQMTGGTSKNTVPERAECALDIRYETVADAESVVSALRAAAEAAGASVPGVRMEVMGGANRLPLERTDASAALRDEYAACARACGLGDGEAPLLGGGSDANTVAPLGVPAIDGLGPRGAGFHTTTEYVELASFVPKAEALVRFLWGPAPGVSASRVLAICAALAACHGDKPLPSGRAVTPTFDASWADRCLGRPHGVDYVPATARAAHAAAHAALDGATEVPQVEPASYAPQRQAEVAWMVAAAALATKQPAGPLVDGAFAAVSALTDADKRDPLFAAGAIALEPSDPVGAAKWTAKITRDDYRWEVAAYDVVRRAAASDADGARAELAKLPASWVLFSDVESWPTYPRSLASAGATACVALAAPAFAASPVARALVEDAEKRTASVTEDWRKNREYRAVALAWARLGDLDRALAAASKMPGTERSGAIADVLDAAGDAPGVDVAHLARTARGALGATPTQPLVLGEDSAAVRTVVQQVIAGDVEAAIQRRYIAVRDLAAAAAIADALPAAVAASDVITLQLVCARAPDDAAAIGRFAAGSDPEVVPTLVQAAVDAGCLAMVEPLLRRTGEFPERIAEAVVRTAIRDGRLDTARALLTASWFKPDAPARAQAELAFALARAGRGADARAVFAEILAQESAIWEATVVSLGYRAAVELAALGDIAGARAILTLMDPRFARLAK